MRAYGVSTGHIEQLKKFNADGGCGTLQIDYSILNRLPEADCLPYCEEENIGVIVRGALAMGILAGKFSASTTFDENDFRRRWLDNPAGRFGWILVGAEDVSRTSKRFDSRENDDVARRPMLTINFTPVEGCDEPLLGDLDADCRVDLSDLAILASQWLRDERHLRDAGTIAIEGVGEFTFDPRTISTVRPDIFQPGSFSLFDIPFYTNTVSFIFKDYRSFIFTVFNWLLHKAFNTKYCFQCIYHC